MTLADILGVLRSACKALHDCGVVLCRVVLCPAACTACQKAIEGAKGKLIVKQEARAVSERDDRLLAETLEALENANKEVGL